MEEVYDDVSYSSTFSTRTFIGARVLTPSGFVLGKIKAVLTDQAVTKVKGMLLSRGGFKKDLYIGREYFSSFTSESCILKDEPSLLLQGKVVLSHEGERLGKVVQVFRVDLTNTVDHLVVKRRFSDPFEVKPAHIGSIGKSIILKEGLNVPKQSFWHRSS